ncbi:hypothetical protein MMH89_01195 [Candidatus Comchoanobacter bicostacola]|uniref:Uncharacterized protein n=1 Tax=Candidatus Comchoanobacter bicostacola TaxID=2919598 RepID=A0ABY5DML4_9GAMM|nr:hypothetical protein [Candidatus Comchoanobacter bicostacola]UTC24769.1 hypothetical protein MMH89_01195 [Candidatus Comchoanobacter bicostacola]
MAGDNENPTNAYVADASKKFREEFIKAVVPALVLAVSAPFLTGAGLISSMVVLGLGVLYGLGSYKLRSDQKKYNISKYKMEDMEKEEKPSLKDLKGKADLSKREDLTSVQKLAIYTYQQLEIESSPFMDEKSKKRARDNLMALKEGYQTQCQADLDQNNMTDQQRVLFSTCQAASISVGEVSHLDLVKKCKGKLHDLLVAAKLLPDNNYYLRLEQQRQLFDKFNTIVEGPVSKGQRFKLFMKCLIPEIVLQVSSSIANLFNKTLKTSEQNTQERFWSGTGMAEKSPGDKKDFIREYRLLINELSPDSQKDCLQYGRFAEALGDLKQRLIDQEVDVIPLEPSMLGPFPLLSNVLLEQQSGPESRLGGAPGPESGYRGPGHGP